MSGLEDLLPTEMIWEINQYLDWKPVMDKVIKNIETVFPKSREGVWRGDTLYGIHRMRFSFLREWTPGEYYTPLAEEFDLVFHNYRHREGYSSNTRTPHIMRQRMREDRQRNLDADEEARWIHERKDEWDDNQYNYHVQGNELLRFSRWYDNWRIDEVLVL